MEKLKGSEGSSLFRVYLSTSYPQSQDTDPYKTNNVHIQAPKEHKKHGISQPKKPISASKKRKWLLPLNFA